VRPIQKVLRALSTTLLTLAVIGGIAYGGIKASEKKLINIEPEKVWEYPLN
jgi:hypothetical protein